MCGRLRLPKTVSASNPKGYQIIRRSFGLLRLQDIDAEALARHSGFLARSPRKIPIDQFLKGLLALAPETDLSLERAASVIGLAAQTTYTKQALSERLSHPIQPFLAQVITTALGQLPHSVDTSRLLEPFARVLVQDSTVQSLPKHLAPICSPAAAINTATIAPT